MARILCDGDLDAVVEPGFDEIGDLRVADRQRARIPLTGLQQKSRMTEAKAFVTEL